MSVLAPTTIDATGKTDATPALQRFLSDDVKDGQTATLQPNGRYRLDGTLHLTNRKLDIESNGAQLFGYGDAKQLGTKNARIRSQLFVQGGQVGLHGVSVKGANPNAGLGDNAYNDELEAQHCVWLSGVDRFTLDHCPLSDPYGDFVYLGSAPGTNKCVRILGSPMVRSGRNGITLNGVQAFLLDDSPIDQVRFATFDFEPTSGGAVFNGVTIRNTAFGSHRFGFFAATGGVLGVPMFDLSIEDNTSTSPFTVDMRRTPAGMAHRVSWLRNRSTGAEGNPSGFVQRYTNVDVLTLVDNVQPLQKGRTMAFAEYVGCTNVTDTNNVD